MFLQLQFKTLNLTIDKMNTEFNLGEILAVVVCYFCVFIIIILYKYDYGCV